MIASGVGLFKLLLRKLPLIIIYENLHENVMILVVLEYFSVFPGINLICNLPVYFFVRGDFRNEHQFDFWKIFSI